MESVEQVSEVHRALRRYVSLSFAEREAAKRKRSEEALKLLTLQSERSKDAKRAARKRRKVATEKRKAKRAEQIAGRREREAQRRAEREARRRARQSSE